jgi:MEMO1 family protein
MSELPHPLVRLAAASIQAFVCEGRTLTAADAPLPVHGDRAGVFVTLTKPNQSLRGCIGTIAPVEATLAEEVIHNAISAATRDPRFPPIEENELSDLVIEVSVLQPPDPITSAAQLDPARYGVIVQQGRKRGLLLPDIPGIDDAAMQIRLACQKAGIGPGDTFNMSRFEVTKYE